MHPKSQESLLLSTLALAVIVGKVVSAALSNPAASAPPDGPITPESHLQDSSATVDRAGVFAPQAVQSAECSSLFEEQSPGDQAAVTPALQSSR